VPAGHEYDNPLTVTAAPYTMYITAHFDWSGGSIDQDCNENSIPDGCEYPDCPGILLGDMDCSGIVDVDDIPAFVSHLLSGTVSCDADMNSDGAVDGRDIAAFITAAVP